MILMLALAAAPAGPASAETSNCTAISSVPTTITTQGVYCLTDDLSTAITTGAAITIDTNNVTIDCNDRKLGGLAAGSGTQASGIYANARLNIAVRNCSIRGFLHGVYLSGSNGGYHLIENNRFDLNTSYAIRTHGDGTTIRGNRVYDTGGSTVNPWAFGINVQDNADIIDNVVAGVVATVGDGGSADGIVTSGNDGGEVSRNRVSGLSHDGAGFNLGIWANGGRPVIRSNTIIGNVSMAGSASAWGIRCNSDLPVAVDNVVNHYGENNSYTTCTLSSNLANW
ncbi:MAG TPA: hypothetical protein VGD21_03230 [Lysobacter sp.]